MISQLKERKAIQTIRNLHGATDTDRHALKNLGTLIDKNLGYALFRSIEEAKCGLSLNQTSLINFADKKIIVRENITRKEFEAMANDKFEQVRICIDATLSRSGVSPEEIDSVLLTGGSSFIPKIQELFSDKFGRHKLVSIDAFTSVAYGLGISASRY